MKGFDRLENFSLSQLKKNCYLFFATQQNADKGLFRGGRFVVVTAREDEKISGIEIESAGRTIALSKDVLVALEQ